MKAVHLQTEYLTEPLGLGLASPRFYWNCEGGISQSAYQIVVKRGDEIVWDTGKVSSPVMSHIRYKGKPLKSRDIVDWSVTLWDENDQPGESSESHFELGLLSPADWKAQWISGSYKPKKGVRYPADCFKKEFTVNGKIKKARLYSTARGVYDVTVNGQRINDFILAPGMTDYRKRIQYQTYDVTALLDDSNTLELRLADGWFRGSVAAYGVTNVYGMQTSVLAQLEITYEDGQRETICTGPDWDWSNDGPIRFADLKDGEIVDASMRPTYGSKAQVVAPPKNVAICASNNVPVTEHERFTPTLLTAEDGTKVLDFGQNIAGYVEFTVQGEPGQRIKLICGEVLDEKGLVDMSLIQESRPAKGWTQLSLMQKLMTNTIKGENDPTPRQEIVFTCSGGMDHYKTSFAVFGFRYAQVACDFEIDPANFTAIAVYSDMEQTGDFTCSDEWVNRLLENTRWSMKGNFLDVPTDCPTRERLGWTGDAQIFFDTGAYLMNTAPFFGKWLEDMEDARYKNGLIPSVLPYNGVDMMYKNSGMSVGWADAMYLIPYRYYKRYGDYGILRRHWPMIENYAEYLMTHTGLTDKNAAKANPYDKYTYEKGNVHFGEWLEPEEFRGGAYNPREKHPEECTAYLHLAMKTISEIARLLDKPAFAEKCEEYAEGSKKAYNTLFVETGTMDTDRQAKLVRPLALGLLDDKAKVYAKNRLKQAVENYNYRVGTGFLSTPFVLPVLTAADELDTAYKMLENTESPGWLHEVVNGATTIWESWEGDCSRNHYSPGAVCQWLFDTVAGIRVSGPRKFTVTPQPGGSLTHAEGRYQSLYGEIVSSWENDEDGQITSTITVPANTTADIKLPDGEQQTVTAGTYTYTI